MPLPGIIKDIIRPFYYAYLKFNWSWGYLRNSKKIIDEKKIPIIINNRNRVTTLKQLIEALETRGYTNIYIIDNASTYPPLLEYYDTCKYEVFRLQQNVGHLALWQTHVFKRFKNDYFVYTDSDVVPIEECPDNIVGFLWEELKKNKDIYKIGLSLKIDDLPDAYNKKQEVIAWESNFYKQKHGDGFYVAQVDTTFALYKPGVCYGANERLRMLRSAYPYMARHMPWYTDSNNLSEEEQYYIQSSRTDITHWTTYREGKFDEINKR